MKKITILIGFFLSFLIIAQDGYKDKNYDEKIFSYQMNYVETNNISKDDYLKYSKSLSKWDTRPLQLSEIWIMEELHPSSIVPNFFWGSFSRYYEVTIEDAMELPEIFLQKAKNDRLKYINFFSQRKNDFQKLIKSIVKTDRKIFTNQNGLKRVDDLYYENHKYWSYLIPEDSPYPMSDTTLTIINKHFSEIENNILDEFSNLGIYAIYNDEKVIYFLIDGLLDNSFGYIYLKEGNRVASNHLFKGNYKIQIAPKFYYYVAN